MVCETRIREYQTPEERKKEVETAAQRLDAALAAGTVTVKVGPTGSIAFKGWANRDDVSDVCAFRKLTAKGSAALRKALARAEVTAGRKVDPRAVSAGEHSHDGGKTWHPGH
jgi:hypothetical protein